MYAAAWIFVGIGLVVHILGGINRDLHDHPDSGEFQYETRCDWMPIVALWLLAMFWPSPMARHYYLAWALVRWYGIHLVAIALFMVAVRSEPRRRGVPR